MKNNNLKNKIPALIFIIFVAIAIFVTKNPILDIIFIALGLAGFFLARIILTKK